MMAYSWLVILLLSVAVPSGSGSENGLEELVKRLQQQMMVMHRRQEEDRETLMGLMRRQGVEDLDVNPTLTRIKGETDSLRSDVMRLKSDLERVRGRSRDETPAFQQEAAAVRWLQKSMKRLREEIAEIASAQNVSAALREEQRVQSQLLLVHNDVTWLRLEAEQQKANTERLNSAFSQMQKDIDELREQLASASQVNQRQRDEMLRLQDQLNSMETIHQPKAIHDKDNSIQDWSGENSVRLRHSGRRLRKALKDVATVQNHLAYDFHSLRHNQSVLEANSKRIKQQVLNLANETRSHFKVKESIMEALTARLSNVEASNAALEASYHNNSVTSSSVKQLYSSTVQLFEALESVESTCVGGMESLRKELSKIEFNVAQLASSLTIMKEDEKAYEKSQSKNKSETSLVDFDFSKEKLQSQWSSEESESGEVDLSLETLPKNSSSLLNTRLAFLEGEIRKFSRQLPVDCDHLDPSVHKSGVYLLRPVSWPKGRMIEAPCEVDSAKRKWLIIQRHLDSSLDFDRSWAEYRQGFGDVSSNMWLGNEALHVLTNRSPHILRVELWNSEGKFRYAEYSEFRVSSEADSYRLHVGGYSGNASDSFRLHNGFAFSTKDADHDISSTHCASLYAGGWWYGRCQYVNANSNLGVGLVWFNEEENLWMKVTRVEMKIRRRT